MATANLIARMPLSVHTAGKTKTTEDRYNVIKERARIRTCCRSWDGVAFASEINAYLDAKLPAENHLSNNTKSFRDLTPQEVKEAKQQTARRPEKGKASDAVNASQRCPAPAILTHCKRLPEGPKTGQEDQDEEEGEDEEECEGSGE